MRGVFLNETGGPDKLIHGELPDPVPGPGEVLVRVGATDLNHLDTVIRGGTRAFLKITPPHVLGLELAGEVAALGTGVTGLAVGDRVVARAKAGSYAELALADAAMTAKLPDAISYEDAAGLAASGSTAYQIVVDRARVRAGETVLVTAAASGTGTFIVQVAKAAGCRVIATAGGRAKRDLVASIGADATIDHYDEDVRARVAELTDGRGVPVVLDAVTDQALFDATFASLQPGGRYVSYGVIAGAQLQVDVRALFSKGIEWRGLSHPSVDRRANLEAVVALAAAGQVRTVIDRVLPLAAAAEAHQLMDDHANMGKLVLVP